MTIFVGQEKLGDEERGNAGSVSPFSAASADFPQSGAAAAAAFRQAI